MTLNFEKFELRWKRWLVPAQGCRFGYPGITSAINWRTHWKGCVDGSESRQASQPFQGCENFLAGDVDPGFQSKPWAGVSQRFQRFKIKGSELELTNTFSVLRRFIKRWIVSQHLTQPLHRQLQRSSCLERSLPIFGRRPREIQDEDRRNTVRARTGSNRHPPQLTVP